jgi:beta-ribofuranosylaminobenzene 5'-phosphate synthase
MEAYPTAGSGGTDALTPCEAVTVTTGARLHFGFLDPSGRGPRPFGSFGLALDWPRTTLQLRRADVFKAEGPERDRALAYLRRFADDSGAQDAYALHIEEAIPPHSGLGSGTQLALAVGAALAALQGLPLDLNAIAAGADRGKRSGIGIGTFAQGGVVLDGGPGAGTLPPMLDRLPFPPHWRVLLIFDRSGSGLHGASETTAFASLPEFPQGKTAELCRRVLMGALPALAEHDFQTFTAAIGALQAEMGAYYAGLQGGGAYMSPLVAGALHWLGSLGLAGIGQSSWGPTGFAFIASEEAGRGLLDEARARADFAQLDFRLVQGRNLGASIERR